MNGTPITSDEERKKRNREAVKRYTAKNWRVNLILPPETKGRIDALHLQKSNTAFIRDCVLTELDRLERVLK